MEFSYPADVQEFRDQFSGYLDSALTPDLIEEIRSGGRESAGPRIRTFWKELGKAGYLGLGWPKEYGGGGKSLLFLHAFNYEMNYRRLPLPVVTLNTVGPTLMRVGSDEQKQEFLPKILRAEIEFAIGYTEPEAGTDLASLATSAVRDGDDFVINGQKAFTSGANQADYLWLAVRTDADAPKHRGISILIVPIDSDGIEVVPFPTMSGGMTTTTFYNDVRVPVSALVGEENSGWKYMTTQLDFERLAISPVAYIEQVYDWLCDLFRENGRGADDAWTPVMLAEMSSDLSVLKVMDLKTAWMVSEGEVPVWEASLLKVMANELRVKLLNDAMQMLGRSGLGRRGSPGTPLDNTLGTLEQQLRESVILLFGGGSNDVQRDLMATHGLGLAR
jgi:alkylation response protein AidB-like acyl-CoA dehydrogenase